MIHYRNKTLIALDLLLKFVLYHSAISEKSHTSIACFIENEEKSYLGFHIASTTMHMVNHMVNHTMDVIV